MKTHEVIVTYMIDSNGQHIVHVDPPVAYVDEGDEIKFTRRGTLPGKLCVKFTDRQFFDTNNPKFAQDGELHEPDGPVRVKTLPYRTPYDCQMLDENGAIIVERKGDAGGHVEPVENQPVKNPS